MSFNVSKSSGFHEPFKIEKIKKSLIKSGASEQLIQELADQIQQLKKVKSTKEISTFILDYLQKKDPGTAARYNLKYALMELGPAGYSFEKYIAELFKYQGYETQVNQVINGKCIDHEVDFVADNKKEILFVECKFHNRRGVKSDVKVALYIKARLEDIKEEYKKSDERREPKALIVTNTKFTSKTIRYGKCAGIQMLDWSYPKDASLAILIKKLGLYPITTLTCLNRKQKRSFIQHGFVLCRQAKDNIALLKELGISEHQIKAILKESSSLCPKKKER